MTLSISLLPLLLLATLCGADAWPSSSVQQNVRKFLQQAADDSTANNQIVESHGSAQVEALNNTVVDDSNALYDDDADTIAEYDYELWKSKYDELLKSTHDMTTTLWRVFLALPKVNSKKATADTTGEGNHVLDKRAIETKSLSEEIHWLQDLATFIDAKLVDILQLLVSGADLAARYKPTNNAANQKSSQGRAALILDIKAASLFAESISMDLDIMREYQTEDGTAEWGYPSVLSLSLSVDRLASKVSQILPSVETALNIPDGDADSARDGDSSTDVTVSR